MNLLRPSWCGALPRTTRLAPEAPGKLLLEPSTGVAHVADVAAEGGKWGQR